MQKLKTNDNSPLNRLIAYPLVRFSVAGILAVIVTIILILIMKFLLENYDSMARDATEKLFILKTVVLPKTTIDELEQIKSLATTPDAPAISEVDEVDNNWGLHQTYTDIDNDDQPETLEEILLKKQKIISILEGKSELKQ